MDFKNIGKKLISPIVWGNFLAMALFLVVVITGLMMFLNNYTRHGESIEVPDLRGQKPEAAMMRLEALGLYGEISDTGYITTMEPYVLLEQSIAPGKHIKEGRRVSFTINGNGARPLQIPDLANNSSIREAEARLKAMGFVITEHEFIMGDRDWVYALKAKGRELNVGERLPVDIPITLVVGKGEEDEEESLEMDNLSESDSTATQTDADFDKALEDFGL
jgi:beta-lactam-binding protein with PASTA domain